MPGQRREAGAAAALASASRTRCLAHWVLLLPACPQRHVVLTALEVARGLEYIHHADRRMVHRDLSAANVLLTSAGADERGFRALLSDFGLSTSLAQEATHRTSEVKGTIRWGGRGGVEGAPTHRSSRAPGRLHAQPGQRGPPPRSASPPRPNPSSAQPQTRPH